MRRLLPFFLLLVWAPAAPASTVSAVLGEMSPDSKGSGGGSVVIFVYEAVPGEANDLVVRRDAQQIVVIDRGARIDPGEGCTAVDEHHVNCSADQRLGLMGTVRLGDGDDRAEGVADADLGPGHDVAVGDRVKGGPGDDRITGASIDGEDGDDRLHVTYAGGSGGAGDDVITAGDDGSVLHGGGGIDTIVGGAGGDHVHDDDGETPDRDVLRGGGGHDTIRYGGHLEPLHIDLGASMAQAPAADDLSDFENAVGGHGDDVIRGSGAGNRLEGGGGRDHLLGLGGEDHLAGTGGDDRLDGGDGRDFLWGGADRDVLLPGPGDDQVEAFGDAFADVIDCTGGGRDIGTLDVRDRARGGCPRFEREAPSPWVTSLVRSGRSVRVVTSCTDLIEPCHGRATVRAEIGGRLRTLGTVSLCANRPPCPSDATSRPLRLPSSAWRELRRRGRLRVRVTTIFAPGVAAGVIPIRTRFWLRPG